MPLLKKKAFQKAPLPQDLKRNEEVFHCVMTNEIFRDYEEFCQRVILCNSMVWTCTLTGKSGLTYSEALESEQNAQNILKDFPTELRIPVLFLASKTQRTSFSDMAEDVFIYVKDRYFIGENVEASFTGNKWRESHVLQVIAPTEQEIKSAPKNGQSTDRQFHPPASLYRYEVEQLDAEDEDVSEVMIVDCDHIKRKKINFTRDKNKMLLKQFVEINEHGVFVIKEAVLESYGIHKIKFDQIFDGPMPNFEASKKLMRNAVNGKKSKQDTLTRFLNNGVSSSENTINLLDKMKKRQEEFQQLKEALKQKKADEKLAEKQKQKEENIKISMILKDWYKPKEDLELEDHKKIPVPAPLYSKVPDKYIGDVLAILEFVHSFSKLLCSTDFFPGSLTLELMERALMQKEVAGPLTDVIQMFLTALFNVQSDEASQCSINVDNTTDVKGKDVNDNVSLSEATHFATVASNWSVTHQGLPLNKLPLYSLTTSEILRLHLLSSGARVNESGAKWRYQHRGGYTSEDDPALYLRLKQPHILKALALHNITELPVGDKLKVIHCLINQLLTFADIRDTVEDRLEKSKQAKLDLRLAQIADRRREQEYIAAKLKIKKEGRENNNKDITAELDRLSKEAERKKAQSERKMESLMKTATENQTLLGLDRAYRKYVKLESIPGLFVNFEEENPGFCLDERVQLIPNLVGADRTETLVHVRKIYEEMNTSDKENKQDKDDIEKDNQDKEPKKVNGIHNSLLPTNDTDADALMMCSAEASKCIVHSTTKNTQKWSFYHTREQIEELVDSLNKRGIRESELKQAIANEQEYLASLIAQTPVTQLNPNVEVIEMEQKLRPKRHGGKNKYEDTNLGYPLEMDSASVLQFALVDNILEIEEKIYAGNLGSIKVKDRNAWREHLSNRHFSDLDKMLVSRKEISKAVDKVKKESKNSRPNTPDPSKEYKDPGKFLGPILEVYSEDSDIDFDELPLFQSEDHKLAVQTLAIALVQVGQGVENKYLKKPLGHAGMRNDAKKTEEHDVMDRWEQSLLAATSYSQIFLHFSTLDNCILWSRSALLARCTVCRRQTDSENMLLCDNCNKGHHLYCLKPKLTSVPKGDWFCKECQKQKDKEAKLKNPEPEPEPQKKRRRIFREEQSDDETSEESVKSKNPEPRKKKSRIFVEESEEETEETSEESENTKEEDVDEEEEEEASPAEEEEESSPTEEEEDTETIEADSEEQPATEEGSEKTEVCTKCGIGGTLLCCDHCPEMYHLECAEPPLRRVPRGEWFCHRCRIKKGRENSDESYISGRVAQRSGITYNQRRCATTARHKIHGFAKTLRRMSESEDSDSNGEVSSSRRSNRREAETRDDLPLHNAPLQELLSDVLKQDSAWPFLRPVQKTEVPDYYDIITKPMDFGTIKYKLNMGEYQCDADLMLDAVLVFENCNTYNNTDDEVYKCGITLLKYFVNRCEELGLKFPEQLLEKDNDNLEAPALKKMRTK